MRLKKLLSYTPQFSKRIDNIILYAPFALAALMFTGCVVYELIQPSITIAVRDKIYSAIGFITFCFSGCLSILYGRKYHISLLRSVIYSALCFLLMFKTTSELWCDIDVELFGSGSLAPFRSVLLLPVLCFLISRIERLDTLTLCDYLTPYYFFDHGLTTHGCWISGCCGGKTMSRGILDPDNGLRAFPVQLYVIILALSISFWGLRYSCKQNYITRGKVYAVSLIAYGLFRFVIEFFTDDLRIWSVLSLYSIYSLLMILLGLLILLFKRKQPVEITKSIIAEELNKTTEVVT